MARHQNDHEAVRRYLLNQLSNVEQQSVELRLLSDDNFAQEVEIVEDELIDEYLADELSSDERVKFEQHFLTSPDRHHKLKSGQALKRYFEKSHPNPAQLSFRERLSAWLNPNVILRPVPAVIAVLVVAVVGPIMWRVMFSKSDLEKGLLALNEAYRQQRPIEARVSELDYAPFVTTRRGEPEQVNSLKLNRAQRFLLDAEQERADAASYHALGKLFLLQKDAAKAIEYLERAAKNNSGDAQIYSDLGAAYLEKAKQELESGDQVSAVSGQSLEALARSLEYLKRSLEINPNLLEALFNRGLVHQYQGLDHEAETDWRAYLEKDPDSQWAAEARQKLKLLEEKKTRASQTSSPPLEGFFRAFRGGDDAAAWEIYRRSYARGGNTVTKALVTTILSGNTESRTENLQALNYIGQLELRKVDDAYTSDLAKVYSSVNTQTQPLLVQAREQVNQAYELFNQSRIGEAIELFASARSTFEKAGNLPESIAAAAAIAHAAAVQPDVVKGQEILALVLPVCEWKNYKWLLADALFRRAHIQTNLDNYSEAISDGSRALQIFQELRDSSSTLASLTQLASLHMLLNDREKSFSFLHQAMNIAEHEGTPARLWGIHLAISLNLIAMQLYRAALDYQNEALHLALASVPRFGPLMISRSYQYIGLTYGFLRQFDLAVGNMRNAYEQGMPLAGERNGQNMMANASLKLGDVYRLSGDQANALIAYEESLRLYEGLGFAHYSYLAHKGKFLSYLAQNDDAMAFQELLIVLRLFDEYREKILGERQTSFFFDKEQDTYDLAIDFAYSRMGDERRAYEYSETCRARNLRELMQHGAETTQTAAGLDLRSTRTAGSQITAPLTWVQIKEQLPEQVQIVQYAMLEKKLLIWYATRSSEIFVKAVDVESTKVAEIVANAVRQIQQQDQSGASQSLKNLYNLLVEPIKDRLNSRMVLCFVPDKILHYVPFTALLSGSGRYLAQDYRVMVSPSTTILIESTNKAQAKGAVSDERLLAVGNPRIDRTKNLKLTNLPGAELEVKGIASNYRNSRVLTGDAATRTSVIAELARANVAHFAAHYQIDPGSRLSSRLLLAPESGERAHSQPSALSSADIYRMNLARTRLVFLSACDTGIEQQFGGEGPIGFARSFLVAGVPVVVASLWAVDSDATSQLMIEVHRLRRHERLSTNEALMRAQQRLISSENYRNPYYWAGFTVIGGYSDF